MKQNTAQWLDWRRRGLGASDAPIVLGKSPYKSRRQLFDNKLKLRPDDRQSLVTDLGHIFEPRARAQFELLTGSELKADVCKVHKKKPHIRASLDGDNESERVFAEIKFVGEKKWQEIRREIEPTDEHYPQIQQQFIVTGYDRGFYIAYTLDEKRKDIARFQSVEVKPNFTYMEYLEQELDAFWRLVETQTPPELEDRDRYTFTDRAMIALAQRYKFLKSRPKWTIETRHLESRLEKIASPFAEVTIGPIRISKDIVRGEKPRYQSKIEIIG